MIKNGLFILLLGTVTLGTTGSAWSQAQCLSMMSATQPSCCCPTQNAGEDHCPTPSKTSDCPMFSQAAQPASADVPFKFAPHVAMVSFGIVVVDDLKPYLIFNDFDSTPQSVRTDRLRLTVPPFRAPPAAPVAA